MSLFAGFWLNGCLSGGICDASVDPLNRRSASVYNNVGAVTDSFNPAGSRSTTVYNVADQTIASVDAKGSRSTVAYL